MNYSDPTDDLGRRIKQQQVSWSRSSLVALCPWPKAGQHGNHTGEDSWCSKGENHAADLRVSGWLEPLKWDQLKPSGNAGSSLGYGARGSSHFRAVVQVQSWECCHPTLSSLSQREQRIKGINPRASFVSPDGKYRLVNVSETGKEAVPWSPLLSSGSRSGFAVFQLVTPSSVGVYLALAAGWAQAGWFFPSVYVDLFPTPCHCQTATVWMGLCPKGHWRGNTP